MRIRNSTLSSSQRHNLSRGQVMTNEGVSSFSSITVLLADSKPMESQLLAGALRHHGFHVSPCESELTAVLELADHGVMDVAVLSCGGSQSGVLDMTVLRTLHLSYPQIPKVVLMDVEDRELAVQSFRLGARGLFCLADSSFQRLCECIQRVHGGEIWATTQQLNYLLDSVCQVPSLRVVSANGEKLLTSREEQVVALVADGLSNRSVATELGLSEHTVKKYLFRIFEKLGISNRVELVLYAVHHGSMQQTEWIAG
jgi:DNA-binding NarL/FixJ family response regulator